VSEATGLDRARHEVKNADWLNALARVGLVAIATSYALVGILAIRIAVESGGKGTSQGALHSLAQHWFGKFVLVLLVLGFASYALWRFAQTFFDKNDVGDGAKGAAQRAGYFGAAAIYAAIAYSTAKIISGAAQQSQRKSAHKAPRPCSPGPPAVDRRRRGHHTDRRRTLERIRRHREEVPEQLGDRKNERSRAKLGRALGRRRATRADVVFILIGIFLIKAAHDYSPREAISVDGALQKLVNQSYGSWLLGIVAVGLLAYSVFCLFEARYSKV
jgi:hypothetical protein